MEDLRVRRAVRCAWAAAIVLAVAAGCARGSDTGNLAGTSSALTAPEVDWATLLGGSGNDSVRKVVANDAGGVFLAGLTAGGLGMAVNTYAGGPNDGYVAKFAADGTLLWTHYFGTDSTASDADSLRAVVPDGNGGVYAVGVFTGSSTVEVGALNSFDTVRGGSNDGYIAHLDADGSRIWAAYLGGDDSDSALGVDLDADGNLYLAMQMGFGFPVTAGGDTTFNGGTNDAGIMKIAGDGSAVLWASYLGGSGSDSGAAVMAVDGGAIVVGATASSDFPAGAGFDTTLDSGLDGFVARMADPGVLQWASYVGGAGFADTAERVAVDSVGRAVVAARVQGTGLPIVAGLDSTFGGAYDLWIGVVASNGGSLVWSTYLGGTGDESTPDVTVDEACNVYLATTTPNADAPIVDAFSATPSGTDAFYARVNAGGASVGWSTYFGGSGSETTAGFTLSGAAGIAAGTTLSSDFPANTGDTILDGTNDGFVVRLPAAAPRIGGLAATDAGGGAIEVGWTLDTPSGATEMRLLRGQPCMEPWTVLQSWTIDGSVAAGTPYSFIDAAPGTNAHYRVEIVLGATSVPTFGPVSLNTFPIADDDAYATPEDTDLVVAAPGVLDGDTDADADALSAVILVAPTSGTLALAANGSFTYTPAPDASGNVTFTYRVSDGRGGQDDATVTVEVSPVDDPPVAYDVSATAAEDPLFYVSVPPDFIDVDGCSSCFVITDIVTQPSIGSAEGAGGSMKYYPPSNFHGTVSFTYRVNYGLWSEPATAIVTITPVNDSPVAQPDAYSGDEDQPIVIAAPGLLSNDTDVEDTVLRAAHACPEWGCTISSNDPQHTFVLSTSGSFVFTPEADWSGTSTYYYRAYDSDGGSATTTVSFTVNAVNDPPVASDDAYAIDEDALLVVGAPSGVLANDDDVDSGTITAVLVGAAGNGTVTLSSDGSFTYAPAPDWSGIDSFTYQANDGDAPSTTATVTVTVTPVNDPPAGSNDAYAVSEDTTLAVNAAMGVLANDGDVDSTPLVVSLVAGVANGTLALGTDGSFTYVPDANTNGDDTFTYAVSDGALSANATVTITVDPVNDAPTVPALAAPADGALFEDGLVTFSWNAATDADGDPVTYRFELLREGSLVDSAEGASLSHEPIGPLEDGIYTWRVEARDGTAGSGFSAERSLEVEVPSGGGSGCACSTVRAGGPGASACLTVVPLLAFLARRRRSAAG